MPLLGWGDFWTLPLARAARARRGRDDARRHRWRRALRALFLPAGRSPARRAPAGGARARLRAARRRAPRAAPRGGGGDPLAGSRRRAAVPAPQAAARAPRRARARPAGCCPAPSSELCPSDDPLAWKRLDGPRWWAYTAERARARSRHRACFENQRRWAATAGLEVRLPLLDLDLVELGLRQPPRATFDRRFSRPLLRDEHGGLAARLGAAAPAEGLVRCPDRRLPGRAPTAARCAAPRRPRRRARRLHRPGAMRGGAARHRSPPARRPLGWMWLVWRLLTAELWLRAQASPVAKLGASIRPAPRPSRGRARRAASYLFPTLTPRAVALASFASRRGANCSFGGRGA